jgi:cell division protein FtsI (penicillin-binding protein 3)
VKEFRETHISFIPWRFHFFIIILLFISTLLFGRLIHLAIFQKQFLESESNSRILRSITAPAFRGMILDRNGYPLAISASVYSVWMNPKEFQPNQASLKNLSQLLKLKPSVIQDLFVRYQKTNREFIYLKRDVAPPIAQKIKALNIPGVNLQQDYKRYYPEGEVLSHVIGFTNIDDKGQEGLELLHDQWLTGTAGKKMVIKDRLGRVVSNVRDVQKQKTGNDLVLSINRRIQYLAYRELMAGVKANNADSGSLVVLDVKTGEILAMVNQPSFNPNNRPFEMNDALRNRAVTDVFEPGSTIKAFSIASALDSGLYKPNTYIDTSPGRIKVGNKILHDEHNNGMLTVTQVLQISSNVGATKMILSLPKDQLWSTLHRVGFGEMTGIGLPGERSGELVKPSYSSPISLATLAFGYGLSVTTLQLAEAYAVLANHGMKIPLSILRVVKPPQGKRVMNATVATQMLQVLESVVEKGGTGRPADIPGYRIAGKTGTAWVAGPNGYEKHRYVASFVGIAPASDPRYVVAVVIHNPKGKNYLGGYVSGPVFRKVMEGTLHLLSVPTDAEV